MITPSQPTSKSGGSPAHALHVLRPDDDHADAPIAGERMLGHLPIARLEDVQRGLHAREEHDVREREERQSLERGHGLEGITRARDLDESRPRPKTRAAGMDERLAHGLMERLNARCAAHRAALRPAIQGDRRRARQREAALRRLLRGRLDPHPPAPHAHRALAQVLEPREHAVPRARAPAPLQSRAALPGLLPRAARVCAARGHLSAGQRRPSRASCAAEPPAPARAARASPSAGGTQLSLF